MRLGDPRVGPEPVGLDRGETSTAEARGDPVHQLTFHGVFIVAVGTVWISAIAQADEANLPDSASSRSSPHRVPLPGGDDRRLHARALCQLSSRLLGVTCWITVMIHGLPTFIYEHLRFSWAWKHVGIVEFILRTGGVDPQIDSLPAYHNWPGFFGLNAWIVRESGLDSPMSYATWAPILFNLLYALALFALFRGFSADRRLVWTAVLIFELGNWVGQDYFAPQALAFFLYLVVMMILLRWFSTSAHRRDPDADEPMAPGTLEAAAPRSSCSSRSWRSRSRTSSHLSSPCWRHTLRLFKVIRVTWPIVAMVVFGAAWAFGPARDFVIDNLGKISAEFGGFQANLDNNLVTPRSSTVTSSSSHRSPGC